MRSWAWSGSPASSSRHHQATGRPQQPHDLAPDRVDAQPPGHPSIRFIPARRGRKGYFGPRPLPRHGLHRYGFHLYALDHALPDPLTGLDDVLAAAAGHVLADGFLEGVKKG
jgi:phosphatidylethanolamine-binding protein (PEBP) family uncharacterized protein